ncbi:MAG: malto-oligosyltrehalose synthase [Acidobacteria bacterium]|nr:malto-oligosyltrehalose synthase [Acidobacteriota bacterium]
MTEFPDRLPVTTYRVQLGPHLKFDAAADHAAYISRLGATELYCSPILAASPGSSHGYDTCDHSRINPEWGGDDGFARLCSALRALDLGLVLDFVPNHMGIQADANRWWRDVLENGPSSPYAQYFDIDWSPVKDELQSKLLLPILGNQYGVDLDAGRLRVEMVDGDFRLRYYDHILPLNPRQLCLLLRHDMDRLPLRFAPSEADLTEFLSILFHLDHIPAYTASEPDSIAERQREKEVAKKRLAGLLHSSAEIRRHVESNVELFNGTPGNAASFDLLHALLEAQPYRLSFWRTAMHEINYRRFFDVNELAGIRMEDPAVFHETHRLILKLIRDGAITGLRLDHVDGLFHPAAYFGLLNRRMRPSRIYLVAEKILSENEELREDWEVHGTTGYEFLNLLNGIFVDRGNANEFRKLYARFTGTKRSWTEVVYAAKKLIISNSMASELNVLAHELNRISESDRHYRDFTLPSLREALTEITACFPAYRTYFHHGQSDAFDRRNVEEAIERALRRNPAMEPSIFAFIREMLLPRESASQSRAEYERRVHFAMKFQQYTGPVQAKGLEDTAFYRYGPLLSLNEVGGHPGSFGVTIGQFHRANQERLRTHPLSMICTSTHDTKRGEDVRARLNVLSEIPQQWRDAVTQWARINASARTRIDGAPAPDRSDEYLYYQTLTGAWPAAAEHPSQEFAARITQYMNKAVKEKKVHSSWVNPNEAYDEAVARFVHQTLLGTRSAPFLAAFLPFQRLVPQRGMIHSLSQVVLKATSPGVPDFYQGTEVWDLNLVDPDNRRAVDFAALSAQLDDMQPWLASHDPRVMELAFEQMLAHWQDGRIKHFLTAAVLRFRRQFRTQFLRGTYVPLQATGPQADAVVGFARSFEDWSAVVVCPRRQLQPDGLNETRVRVPPGAYRNVFTQQFTICDAEGVSLDELFRVCPVALLHAQGER